MAEIRPIFKARVSSIEGTKARVVPLVGGDVVTRPLAMHWTMLHGMCDVAPGDLVVCARFEDGDGIVLCRADGAWNAHFGEDITVDGTVAASGDMTAAGISASTHTHMGVHGQTSGPQ